MKTCTRCKCEHDGPNKACQPCSEKSKLTSRARYQMLRQNGLCKKCKSPSGGKTFCEKCSVERAALYSTPCKRREAIRKNRCECGNKSVAKFKGKFVCGKCLTPDIPITGDDLHIAVHNRGYHLLSTV